MQKLFDNHNKQKQIDRVTSLFEHVVEAVEDENTKQEIQTILSGAKEHIITKLIQLCI